MPLDAKPVASQLGRDKLSRDMGHWPSPPFGRHEENAWPCKLATPRHFRTLPLFTQGAFQNVLGFLLCCEGSLLQGSMICPSSIPLPCCIHSVTPFSVLANSLQHHNTGVYLLRPLFGTSRHLEVKHAPSMAGSKYEATLSHCERTHSSPNRTSALGMCQNRATMATLKILVFPI